MEHGTNLCLEGCLTTATDKGRLFLTTEKIKPRKGVVALSVLFRNRCCALGFIFFQFNLFCRKGSQFNKIVSGKGMKVTFLPALSAVVALVFCLILQCHHCDAIKPLSSSLLINKETFVPASFMPENDLNSEKGQPISQSEESKKKPFINFRFMEGFFKNILSIYITDPDTLRIVTKACSFIFWAYSILSAFGSLGFDTKPLLSLVSVLGK
jgi:hypothetical protein